MKHETTKAQIKRNTIDRPPRFNVVTISGKIEILDSTSVIDGDRGDSAVTTVVLDNGIEFSATTYLVKELGLRIGDLVLVRGSLSSMAFDTLTDEVHRVNTIHATRIRILKPARALRILEDTFPICETVEIRGVEYRVEANFNRESEELEDLEVFIGDEKVTDHLEDLYVKKTTGSYSWIVDELYAEVVGRRGE